MSKQPEVHDPVIVTGRSAALDAQHHLAGLTPLAPRDGSHAVTDAALEPVAR
ncbi:hypothetical protein [Cellulomonas soli]|uniref:Uncharacterized protein n=1 Tax=Cellulomonas soli TaxID=931535 RepID=A0A512PGA7_9CELL|nr:hypothetical protein [Cellulomonas soli]NYI58078.1 hypothetical protein [Cellulomonas soli]GEP70213.1 hypothetical protein CSO01_29280 [Cellulomonas soli]